MAKNIDQVFTANPITSNAGTDLMYFGQSPYGSGDDAAMTFTNFSGQFPSKSNIQNQAFNYAADTGTTNVYAITLSPAISAYANGQLFTFKALHDNNGASTINVNGLGAKSIVTNGNNPLVGGEILANGDYLIAYNSTYSAFVLLNINAVGISASQIQNQAFTFALDTNVANVYRIALSPAVTSYSNGQLFIFQANQSNTGASTLNVNGVGAQQIVTNDINALTGREILLNRIYMVLYSSTFGAFILLNPSNGFGAISPSEIQNQAFTYVTDTGAANAYVIALSPAVISYIDGQLFSFKAAHANTGSSTLNVNGVAVKSIVTNGNSALVGGEILANGDYLVSYNSTYSAFVLINSSLSGGGGSVTPQNIQDQSFTFAVDSGVANAYAVALSPALTSYQDGQIVSIYTVNSNTTSSTLNVNGLGAVNILSLAGNNLTGGEILFGMYSFIYSATDTAFYLMNSYSPWVLNNFTGIQGGAGTGAGTATGSASFAFIGNSSGTGSIALGNGTSSGTNSAGFGNGYTASASASLALGAVTADAANATALGNSATSNGQAGALVMSSLGSFGTPYLPNAADHASTYLSGSAIFFICNDNANFGSATLTLKIDNLGNVINLFGEADQSKTILTPSSGGTVTLSTANRRTILNPSGTLATLTVNMPPSPIDGQLQTVTTTQVVTALTVSGNGHSIAGQPTALVVGQSFTMIYDLSSTTWYPG